jgi:bifunctional DNase/RNase
VPIQVELKRIIINEIEEDQVVVLHEVDGERSLPIVIGLFEATSIDRRVKGISTPRPLTHDLIVNAVELLGGEMHDVLINELKHHTYFARLRVQRDGELVEIDCRPSDAIAVAVTAKIPIYVNEQVFGDADDD